MSWARFDDQMAFNAKIIAAGNAAVGAWARMICWSCAHLTDGRVPRVTALLIAGDAKTLARAVAARLLHDDGGEEIEIHDFLEWNPPSERVRSARKAEAARKAEGRSRQGRGPDGRVTSGRPSGGCPPGQVADVRPDSDRNPAGRPPVPIPIPIPIPEIRDLVADESGDPPSEKPKGATSRRTRCPASTDLEAVGAFIARWELPSEHHELSKFLDYHAGKGSVMLSWSAAWRTWVRNAPRFGGAERFADAAAPAFEHSPSDLRRLERQLVAAREREAAAAAKAGGAS